MLCKGPVKIIFNPISNHLNYCAILSTYVQVKNIRKLDFLKETKVQQLKFVWNSSLNLLLEDPLNQFTCLSVFTILEARLCFDS